MKPPAQRTLFCFPPAQTGMRVSDSGLSTLPQELLRAVCVSVCSQAAPSTGISTFLCSWNSTNVKVCCFSGCLSPSFGSAGYCACRW